ncbi:MAG: sulfatase [Clostridia bacterium]|nr:sulfatase [Clostridia bacterium]
MTRPNIIFIMTDDHASHAMSCYGSKINETPNMDRIADGGVRFNNCFCTNSICAPSRATILTGTHTHINGVKTLGDKLDNSLPNLAKIFQKEGYSTAVVGKWHLGQGEKHHPTGFDYWNVLPGQGDYFDPVMIEMGERKIFRGYVTDIITDKSIEWLENRDAEKPFMLMCHHKAPHRPWLSDDKHRDMYSDYDIPLPDTFFDDYENRSEAAKRAEMRVDRHMNSLDLKIDIPEGYEKMDRLPIPDDVSGLEYTTWEGEKYTFKSKEQLAQWKYQRYIKEYLRCVASVDDGIGRMLDWLDEKGLTESTMVIYTSDQGFYLGDHGWYDKRFMYEESLRMPLVIRYPEKIKAGAVKDEMVLNLDFARTFLDAAGIEEPDYMQGRSFMSILQGETPDDWQTSMYYRYWMHLAHHNVAAHYGIRTMRYQLIYYYGKALGTSGSIDVDTPEEWELFDLEEDPCEMMNVYNNPEYRVIREELKKELYRLKEESGDYE